MIPLSSATRIFVVTGATDMRKGFDGLYGIVANRLGMDPTSGHLFVFCNATRTRIKVLTWDGSGLWLCNKRLEPNPHRPRSFGGKGAEGMKKGFPSSPPPGRGRGKTSMKLP
jgi:transposase